MKDIGKIQRKSLELFLYFQKICREEGLLFYLCGGCCIGAIRHKGFIPWDDDVDIFMPRDDYEKLKLIWQEKADFERYPIMYPREDFINHNLFITIADTETTYVRPYQQHINMPHCIVLDILPLDGCPSNRLERMQQMFWAMIYSLYCAQLVPVNHGTAVSVAGNVLLNMVYSKSFRYKIWCYAEKQMSKWKIKNCDKITELCSGPHYMKNEYPQEAFIEASYSEFEGYQVPLPIGYHEYLTIAFGGYMDLPPVEKQVAHHDVIFCDLDCSYKKYEGKFYCKGKR